jgi:uncharacterized protein (DUF1501 family)
MQRRKFLQRAAATTMMPGILGYGSNVQASSSSLLQLLTNAATETNHVLVIIRLNGGNDGLNMVVPLDQYANLATARPQVLINENAVLKLNNTTATGLHPALTGVRDLYNEGKVKIIQSVGYPNQNFSHFRSTDIWMSASDAKQDLFTGWMGRYMMNEYPNYPNGYPNTTMPDPLAVQVGDMTLTFMGGTGPLAVSYPDLNNLYNFNDIGDAPLVGRMGKELDYIRLVAKQADKYGDAIALANSKGTNSSVVYPTNNTLATQLKAIAKLVKGGIKTRVFMVNIGGFDTHSYQVDPNDHSIGSHANLMKQMNDAIFAFQRDLEALKIADRVLGMTFSEFGRRIKSNSSFGTDHGAALPMFVFGTSLHGGILGANPTIASTVDVNANIPFLHDFRSVYASILADWFCVNPTDLNKIMLKDFSKLKIVNAASCVTDTNEIYKDLGVKLISNYPNPFDFATTIEFETKGGHTLIQILDVEGRMIAKPVDGTYAEGKYKVYYNGGHLPAGVYYARYQNGPLAQVHPMLKVQ